MHGRNHKRVPGEDRKKIQLRDNLLVTAGARAAYMECMRYITLPAGTRGKDELARFIIKAVDLYLNEGIDIPFDTYIENSLTNAYRNNKMNILKAIYMED